MIPIGTLCIIVGPVLHMYESWLGRIVTVTGVYTGWYRPDETIYTFTGMPPYPCVGAHESNLRPIVPEAEKLRRELELQQ